MKKRILCSLLAAVMCFSQAPAVAASTVSDNAVIGMQEAEDETQEQALTDAGAEDGANPEDEITAETAGQAIFLQVPKTIEIGMVNEMQMTITPSTEYAVRFIEKATGKKRLEKSGTSKDSSENFLTMTISIGKEDLSAGDYEVQYWTGDYDTALAAGQIATADLAVRKSIRAEVNQDMAKPVVQNAVYTGKNVLPTVILKETVNDVEQTLVIDIDFTVTVISDNKKELGKAKAKIEGKGNYAGSFEVDYDIVPQAPAITGVESLNASSVKVTWNKSENAQGYYIDRKAADGTFVNVGKVSGTVTTYTDTTPGMNVGDTYYYRVQACATSAVEADKEVVSIPNEIGVAVRVLPAAPQIVSLENVSTTKLKLTWKKSDEADGYRVYQIENGKLKKVKDIKNPDTTSLTIKKLSCGYTYQYCVEVFKKNAVGANIYSEESKKIKAKVRPAVPQLVSVKSIKATENQVKWKKVSGAYGYYVYRKEKGSSSWRKIANVKNGSAVTYNDTKAVTGKKYIYTVKAYAKAKVNGKTKTISGQYDKKGISGTAVAAKTVFSLKQNTKGVLITIANAEGADGYYLYRKKGNDKWTKRDVPAQAGDTTVYLDRDIVAKTDYQYYVVPYSKTETGIVKGTASDTQKFTTK